MAIRVEEHCICGMSLIGTYIHLTQEEVNDVIAAWWLFHMGEGHGKA